MGSATTLHSLDAQMHNFTNSEEPGEMSHKVAFHQVIHCLLGLFFPSRKEIEYSKV